MDSRLGRSRDLGRRFHSHIAIAILLEELGAGSSYGMNACIGTQDEFRIGFEKTLELKPSKLPDRKRGVC